MANLDFKYKLIIAIVVAILLGVFLVKIFWKLIFVLILVVGGYLAYIYYKRRKS